MFARLLAALALSGCVASGSDTAPQPSDPVADDAATRAWADRCEDWDEWDRPGPPFRIAANTWYVGTCGISAILITGNEGDVLIDGGTANAGGMVAENIKALGFDLHDVKLILHSHEHHDHVGGIAELQHLTGARLLASREAATAFTTGNASADDPQHDEGMTIPIARVDGYVEDGQVIRLGDLTLTAMATPGHTPGALSWKWGVSCGADCSFEIVYADSLTPVSSDGYRFSDHPAYLAAFRRSLSRIAALNCRILLAPHPSSAGMRADILAAGSIASRTACKDYAAALTKRLDDRLATEATNDR